MDYENEEWRDIAGYEGLYKISSLGRVKSLPTSSKKKGGILKPWKVGYGYPVVVLSNNGWKEKKYIHDLVLGAFVGRKPTGMTCNHLDGDKENNCFENLEYCTQAENNLHAYRVLNRSKVIKRGEDSGSAKLTEADVREIRRLYATGEYTQKEIAEFFPVNDRNVNNILTRKTWKHI